MSSSSPSLAESPTSWPYQYQSLARLQPNRLDSTESSSTCANNRHPSNASYGPPRRLGFMVILPAFCTFLTAAGMASALVGRLLSRRVLDQGDQESGFFHGAIVAAERLQYGNGLSRLLGKGADRTSETTLFGLAISSLAAHLVAFTAPFVLGTYAYLVANTWIRQQEHGDPVAIPTSTQYGLLVGLCGLGGLSNVYDAVSYMAQVRKRKPPIPSVSLSAVGAAVTILSINYGLSSIPLCPGPVESYHIPEVPIGNYSNCQHTAAVIDSPNRPRLGWGTPDLITEGASVVQNTSTISRTILIGDLAILIPATLPEAVNGIVFETFAIQSKCGPVTNCVTQDDSPRWQLLCPSFTPPVNLTATITGTVPPSSVQQYDLSANFLTFERDDGQVGGYALNSSINPAGAQIILSWSEIPETASVALPDPVNSTGWYSVHQTSIIKYWFYVGSCSITTYNISISYNSPNTADEGFTIIGDPELSNFNTTSALLAGLDMTYSTTLASHLAETLRPSLRASVESLNSFIASNMSFTMMGYAAPLFERAVATSGNGIAQDSVSRYPLAPLRVVLALLYLYALLALALSVMAFPLSSREVVAIDTGSLSPCQATPRYNSPNAVSRVLALLSKTGSVWRTIITGKASVMAWYMKEHVRKGSESVWFGMIDARVTRTKGGPCGEEREPSEWTEWGS